MKKARITFAITFATVILASVSCRPQQGGEIKLTRYNIDEVISAMTLEEKCHYLIGWNQKEVLDSSEVINIGDCKKMVPGCAGTTFPIPRLGIPAIVMADGPAGVRININRPGDEWKYYCTAFPIETLLASSWDTDLVYRVGKAFGNEIREYGVDVILAPALNIQRNPLCGRNFEYFSEDPLITGKMAAAEIRGIQSQGVGACPKHLAANNCEINRLYCDSRVDTRTLREIYLKGFEIAVKESDPWMIMTSYNYLNGKYTSEDPGLLEDVLRGDWSFGGAVVSDWGSGQDAVAQILAGNDNLQSGRDYQYRAIYDAAKDGTLPVEAIDKCVRRLLELTVKTPRFRGYAYSNKPELEDHFALVREAAADGIVLLKNEDKTLPLAEGSTIALFGSSSYKIFSGGKGSGDVNKHHFTQFNTALEDAGYVLEPALDSIYRDFLKTEDERLEPINSHRPWYFWHELYRQLPANRIVVAAADAAAKADQAIITIVRIEGEGTDRHIKDDFNLKEDEMLTIKTVSDAFHAAGKKVTVVLNTGAPVEMDSWKGMADAIVMSWQTGIEGGTPIADIISGKVCPSGRLAQTLPVSYESVPSQNFPALEMTTGKNDSFFRKSKEKLYEMPNVDWIDYTEGMFVGYRYYSSLNKPVSYPFGYGLSYTSFDKDVLGVKVKGNTVKVGVKVTNTGECAGREVVQCYSGRNGSDISIELRSFAKTPLLQPGESCTVNLDFPVSELAYFDSAESAWIAPEGEYEIMILDNADWRNSKVGGKTITLTKGYRKDVRRALEPADGRLFIGESSVCPKI